MKETLVVITYIAGESQGSELALALLGWKKHFKSPHRIVIVGDKPPMEDIEWVEINRLPEKDGEYRPHLDICHKLELVAALYGDKYDGFIWASDDCYAINDFTLEDVMVLKYQDDEMPSKGDNHPNSWLRNLVKTRNLCDKEGFGIINWVTHLPLFFNMKRLVDIIWKYDLTNKSYVIENLYFNSFYHIGKLVKLYPQDDWKFGVYFTPLDRQGFYDALSHKKWVCNSVHGWSDALEEELRKHYGIKNSTD